MEIRPRRPRRWDHRASTGCTEGELLGACLIPNTAVGKRDFVQDEDQTVNGTRPLCSCSKRRSPRRESTLNPQLWFGQVDLANTTLYAQFKGVNPTSNRRDHVRQTVFYPDKPGRNFITVRGFTMEHAARRGTPTAEQMGLIGTHWSKGWIIENNAIRYSRCSASRWQIRRRMGQPRRVAEGYVGT